MLYTPKDFRMLIDQMMRIFPMVATTIATEEYRAVLTPEDITPQSLTNVLIDVMIRDLYEIGIDVDGSARDLVPSYYRLQQRLEVFTYLMPDALDQRIRTSPDVRTALTILLSGDAAAGTESTIQTWLGMIGIEPGCLRPDLEVPCTELYDILVASETWTNITQTLLTLDDEILLYPQLDETSVDAVVAWYTEWRDALHVIVRDYTEVLDAELVARTKRLIDLEFQRYTSPEMMFEFAWSISHRDMPEDTNSATYSVLRKHRLRWRVQSRLMLEHYVVNRIVPTDADIVAMIATKFRDANGDAVVFKKSVDAIPERLAAVQVALPFTTVRMMTTFTRALIALSSED